MYSKQLLSRMLSKMSSDLIHNDCGLDDEEIKHIVNEMSDIECNIGLDELKRFISELRGVPIEKKLEIAEKFVDRKLYEEDICNRYGISRPTIYRWQKQGKLPKFRHEGGKKNYIFLVEADNAVRTHE